MWTSTLNKYIVPTASAIIGTCAAGACSVSVASCEEPYVPIKRHDSRLVPRRLSRLVNEDSRSFVSKTGFASTSHTPNEASEESEQYFVNPDKQQNTMILAPPHNSELVAEVCANLGVSQSRSFWGKFADGECSIKVIDEVRGADCFIIAPMERDTNANGAGALSINDSIMQTILMIGALRRSSAKTITVVLPYVPYSRHMETLPDGIDYQASPPAGSDIAHMVEAIGADRVICVDVHSGAWEGCFSSSVSVNNIDPQGLAVKYFESKRLVNPVIVSPDVVASDRAKSFWKRMRLHGFNCSLATMVNNRKYHEQVTRLYDSLPTEPATASKIRLLDDGQLVLPSGKIISLGALRTREWLVGDVAGRDCIIVDDMIDSGKRLLKTSETLRKSGARRIYMYATHGVLSASAMKRIDESPITELVVTNTICPRRDTACEKLRVLSVAGLISETIRRVQMGESVSSLYDKTVLDKEEDDSRHYQ
jgi:ribose-phosphate pyrophosphokinase